MLCKSIIFCCFIISCNIDFCTGTELVSSIDDFLLSSMIQQHTNIIDFETETNEPDYIIDVEQDDSYPIMYSGIGQIYRYVFDKPVSENEQIMKQIHHIEEDINNIIYFMSNISVSLFCIFFLLIFLVCGNKQKHTRTLVVTDPPPINVQTEKNLNDYAIKV